MSNIEKYPKCHMRTSLGNCDPIGGFCTSVKKDICEALHKVADRPTAEWIEDGYYDRHCVCSNCGGSSGTQFDGVQPIPRKTKFCPNCGAKMFKGGEE